MCFSATSSFIASGALIGVGAASFKAADKKLKIAATIPLLFGIQQGIEGLQWLSPHPGDISIGIGYLYLFFAFALWPVYVPYVLSVIDRPKAKLMKAFLAFGLAVSLYLLAVLMISPLEVDASSRCLNYAIYFPYWDYLAAFYIFVVCGSLLLSSQKAIRFFGAMIFVSSVISAFFFFNYFTSVWCFMAAALSLLVYCYIRKEKTKNTR